MASKESSSPVVSAVETLQEMCWPHAPIHRLSEGGTYLVTAGTYLKDHHFQGASRLGVLCRGLLKLAWEFGWQLEAWAVFSNHYHFVGHSPPIQSAATGGALKFWTAAATPPLLVRPAKKATVFHHSRQSKAPPRAAHSK